MYFHLLHGQTVQIYIYTWSQGTCNNKTRDHICYIILINIMYMGSDRLRTSIQKYSKSIWSKACQEKVRRKKLISGLKNKE